MTNLTPGTGKCAVIGYGSWATAIVKVLSERGIEVRWYIRNPDVLESLRTTGRNCKYLRDVKFDISRLVLSDDINATVAEADTVVLAVPSAFLKVFLQPLEVPLRDKFVISAVKGIIPDEYQTVIDYVTQRYGLNEERTGIITGPSHAEEVGREGLSYLTAVCPDERRAHEFGAMFATDYIRLSYSTDMHGVEYAAIVKNIYAIAVGFAVGLGYGDNFLAVLISNCAMEMSNFLNHCFPGERNTRSSAYLGDLLVTCYSTYSRNRRLGLLIGHGCSVKSALNEMTMIAEGYYAADCIRHTRLGSHVSTPIADTVYEVLYHGASVREKMKELTSKLI